MLTFNEDQSPFAAAGPNNPVTVESRYARGVTILGIISSTLFIGWLRSGKGSRELMGQMTKKRTCI